MKAVSPYYNIWYYTHIYTHNRIRLHPFIRRNKILHALSILLAATGINSNPFPHVKTEGNGLHTKQVILADISSVDCVSDVVRSWRCKVLEKSVGRSWFVVCSDDAIPDSKWGWICDCGCWTWGNDEFHVPISKPNGIVKCGRVKFCKK